MGNAIHTFFSGPGDNGERTARALRLLSVTTSAVLKRSEVRGYNTKLLGTEKSDQIKIPFESDGGPCRHILAFLIYNLAYVQIRVKNVLRKQ